jgi:hypothetical protein
MEAVIGPDKNKLVSAYEVKKIRMEASLGEYGGRHWSR